MDKFTTSISSDHHQSRLQLVVILQGLHRHRSPFLLYKCKDSFLNVKQSQKGLELKGCQGLNSISSVVRHCPDYHHCSPYNRNEVGSPTGVSRHTRCLSQKGFLGHLSKTVGLRRFDVRSK